MSLQRILCHSLSRETLLYLPERPETALLAEKIIVVTDSSKFNRSSLHKIIDMQRVDIIIVDEGIPQESLEGLRKSGIEVILVPLA